MHVRTDGQTERISDVRILRGCHDRSQREYVTTLSPFTMFCVMGRDSHKLAARRRTNVRPADATRRGAREGLQQNMRTLLTLLGVKWTTPHAAESIPLTDAEYAATQPENATALDESDPLYATGVRWTIAKPARKRRVRYIGNGVSGSGKSVRRIKGVTVDAIDAARYAGLDVKESALFVSRFPEDGTMPPPPENAEQVAAISAVFLKVLDTPKRVPTLDLSNAGNVDLS